MHDLRGMAETNTHFERMKSPTRKTVFLETARLYHNRFAAPDGLIPASFEVLYLHGWKNPAG